MWVLIGLLVVGEWYRFVGWIMWVLIGLWVDDMGVDGFVGAMLWAFHLNVSVRESAVQTTIYDPKPKNQSVYLQS